VVCLDGGALGVMCVGVEGVEVGAYSLDGREILGHAGAGFESFVVGAFWGTGGLVGHGKSVHDMVRFFDEAQLLFLCVGLQCLYQSRFEEKCNRRECSPFKVYQIGRKIISDHGQGLTS
jgi:hypothetical protein